MCICSDTKADFPAKFVMKMYADLPPSTVTAPRVTVMRGDLWHTQLGDKLRRSSTGHVTGSGGTNKGDMTYFSTRTGTGMYSTFSKDSVDKFHLDSRTRERVYRFLGKQRGGA